jgi:hypothetical protein
MYGLPTKIHRAKGPNILDQIQRTCTEIRNNNGNSGYSNIKNRTCIWDYDGHYKIYKNRDKRKISKYTRKIPYI